MPKQALIWSLAFLCILPTAATLRAAGQADPAAAQTRVKSKLERAQEMIRAGRKTEAVAMLQALIKSEPDNQAALLELGYLSAGMKRWPLAVRCLKTASAQDPQNMRLHMDLGYTLQSANDLRGAAAEFDQVAETPGEFQTQAETALRTTRDLMRASASSEDAKLRTVLEEGYAALRQGNRTVARKRFTAAAARDPKDATAFKQLGYMNLEDGRLSEASRMFSRARALDPEDQFMSLQLGYVYQRLNQKEQAQQAFKAASASADPKVRAAAEAALTPDDEATEVNFQPATPLKIP